MIYVPTLNSNLRMGLWMLLHLSQPLLLQKVIVQVRSPWQLPLNLYCAQFKCYAVITHSQCTQCSTACARSDHLPPLPPPGSSVSPQSKEKGKHRVGTSPSTVPAKRSAQGEGREQEEEEEEEEEKEGDTTGSTAKRRKRETSHMTGKGH